ncbi:hypothetical protein Poli38472_010671 [Pythium oligandrum]|uniref:Uncharacterized protein n=1 Tax=Pythium oligandrum TaxID=41045 RepID=A0A8K1C3K1_PYTOL|nr:hypothetical protein Poli38472_010671 [Pythium oligandrum]|eukprot:TMW55789.1 hypothetical protein Poli38472_010671 [Pythium oligandrum]
MADAITWKYVSKEQVDRLADHHAMDDCRRELAQVFKIDLEDKKQCFLLDFHVHNYSYPSQKSSCKGRTQVDMTEFLDLCYVTFCRQAHLHPEQISVLLGILQLLMEKDFADDSQTTLEQSYQAFQKLLLDHSVERSPKRRVFRAFC